MTKELKIHHLSTYRTVSTSYTIQMLRMKWMLSNSGRNIRSNPASTGQEGWKMTVRVTETLFLLLIENKLLPLSNVFFMLRAIYFDIYESC